MKRIQSTLIAFSLMTASNAMVGMQPKPVKQADSLQKEVSDAAIQSGRPDAKPFAYAGITSAILQDHKIFQQLQRAAKAEDGFAYNVVITLPMPQQEGIVRQLLTSVVADSSGSQTEDDQEATPELNELFKSIIVKSESAQNTSGLSWGLWWQLKRHGEAAALQYALDNNEFDTHNTDHLDLLKEEHAQSLATHYTTTHHSIDALYKEKIEDLKGLHCYTIVALLHKLQENTAALSAEMEKLAAEQANEKEALLKEHHEAYEKNNTALQKLQAVYNFGDNTQHELTVCAELQASLCKLDDLQAKLERTAQYITCTNIALDQFAKTFAIENNK